MPGKSTIQARIKKEERRLFEVFANIEPKRKKAVDGLLYRAAFLRISLEDLEIDINLNGTTEFFTQSATLPPYQRERPVCKTYSQFSTVYQKITAQLTNMLPKEDPPVELDEFEMF